MRCIPNLIFVSSIILLSVIAGYAQSSSTPSPPKPTPSGTITGVPPVMTVQPWQEFKHEAGNFSVTLPGKPFEMSQVIESEVGKVSTKSFIVQEGAITYTVMFSDYPIAFDTPGAIKGGLDTSREMMLSRGKGKLVSEKEFFFKKYPGRELKAILNIGAVRLRMCLVQQRLYIVFVVAQWTDDLKPLETKQVDRFLDSFQLIEDPPAIPSGVVSISRINSAFGNLSVAPELDNRPVSWREVPWPELGFTVWMPSEPLRKKIPLNPNDQRLDIQIGIARGKDTVCLLMAQPLHSAPTDEATRTIFLKIPLNAFLTGMSMKVESEKTISFEDHSGREYNIHGELGTGIGRVYMIGTTIYLLIGISIKNNDGSEEIARFFDSFRLTKKPDPAPVLGSVSAGSTSLREFTEPGHGYKIILPGEPKKEISLSQGVLVYTMISAGDGIICVVSRERNPVAPFVQSQVDEFYKTYINMFAKAGNLEIIGETKIVHDGHDGREYKLKKFEATGVTRVFLIDRDAYSVSAMAILPGVSEKTIFTILDSFKLIEKSPKDEFDAPPPPPMAIPPKPGTSGRKVKVTEGVLPNLASKKVEPEYPSIAKAAGVRGKVSVNVTVSETGKVIEAEIIKGHPLLRDAALQAARQWEFKPAEISGVPVKIVGVLIFNFPPK